MAEKLAWDFVSKLSAEDKFELVTVLPGFIIGPLIHGDGCSSQKMLTGIVTGKVPAFYPISF